MNGSGKRLSGKRICTAAQYLSPAHYGPDETFGAAFTSVPKVLFWGDYLLSPCNITDAHCTASVELKYDDDIMIAIDTIAVENEIVDNMYERSELGWLIYNAPLEYADLILNGDPEKYLKAVTVYRTFES